MIYPDFAFHTITQIILFVLNCTLTTLSYYWGTNIIVKVYQKNISLRQKLLFSFISAIVLNIFVVYGIAYLNGVVNQTGQLYIGKFINLTKIMLPFSYFILYLLGIHILKLSSYKSLKIMQLSYIYYACCNLILRIAGKLIFPRIPDPRGWNYLRDILMLISGTAIIYILYRLVRYAVDRSKLYVNFPDNILVKSIRYELIKNFLISCLFYSFVTISYYYPGLDGVHLIYMFLICLIYLFLSVTIDCNYINKGKLSNKDEHIVALNHSIDEFQGIRHDFNNILQAYEGYISLSDLDGLLKYHKTVTQTTILAETNLDLSKRLAENPPFFSLLMNKLENSRKQGIIILFALECNMEDVYIDNLDFIRVIGILLDNAIEAAQKSLMKRVSLTSQTKPDGSKLFIISNDTLDEVNTENLFTSGFTTKSGHMGQGLSQARSTLHKYGNSTFNVTYYKHNYTAYLELKPHGL